MKSIAVSKNVQIYRKLCEEIVHGIRNPGELLSEKELCTLFQVSKTPVRQALNELIKDGLVETIPQKGFFVTEVRLVDVLEIYRLREVLDQLAVEASILENRTDTLEAMRYILKEQELTIETGDYPKYLDLDMEFHKAYWPVCQNKRLKSYLERLMNDSIRFSRLSNNDFVRAKLSLAQHKAILEAYEKGDINAAKKAVQAHMAGIREYFKNKL